MTPLAAQMFRHGDQTMQETLARCQFFECTALFPLAREMVEAEREFPSTSYSEFAQLPSPHAVIEAHSGTGRIVLLCNQVGDEIRFTVFVPGADGRPVERARSGIVVGTDRNLETQWSVFPGEPLVPGGQLVAGDRRLMILQSFHITLEKFLCMINQPGLVERRKRDTDKRVMRQASVLSTGDIPLKWHECRIRPGVHGEASEGGGREHQLHYVRKYFKPSINRWVEGYWRGNADLGIHLKSYIALPPRAAA